MTPSFGEILWRRGTKSPQQADFLWSDGHKNSSCFLSFSVCQRTSLREAQALRGNLGGSAAGAGLNYHLFLYTTNRACVRH